MRNRFISEDEFAVMEERVRGTLKRLDAGGVSNARLQESKPARSPYRSQLEAAYAQHLEQEKRDGGVVEFWYEPFSFKLANGKRYRPDFLVWYPPVRGSGSLTGRFLVVEEVKGRWIKNKRDGLTHLVWAAQRFPFFAWRLIERTPQGGWLRQYIYP